MTKDTSIWTKEGEMILEDIWKDCRLKMEFLLRIDGDFHRKQNLSIWKKVVSRCTDSAQIPTASLFANLCQQISILSNYPK